MFVLLCFATKLPPVVLIHGLFSTSYSMRKLEKLIKKDFPNRPVFNFNVLLGSGSTIFNDIDYYVQQFAYLIKNNVDASEIDIVGHSLGAHVARTYTQLYAGHDGYASVRNLISIAGVNSGFYCKRWCFALPPGLLTEKVLGNGFIKHNIIPANIYVNPRLENPVGQLAAMRSVKVTGISKYVCFYSENDDVLKPPVTAGYRFYDTNMTLRDFEDSPDYQNNYFGIKDLYDSGKLVIVRANEFTHSAFIDEKVGEFYKLLAPYLTSE